jgi:hypothetical protein
MHFFGRTHLQDVLLEVWSFANGLQESIRHKDFLSLKLQWEHTFALVLPRSCFCMENHFNGGKNHQ